MFKDNLKKYRNINNFTQDDLASKMFISRTLVSKWESGNIYPTKEHIFKLSEVLNVPIKKLFTKVEIKKILLYDYKIKFIEKLILSISMLLIIVSITLLVFSFVLENTLTNKLNIGRIIPPTRYVLFSLLFLSLVLLIVEWILHVIFKKKHIKNK
jgi:transcriptional regulator with XRE-family HTH domain